MRSAARPSVISTGWTRRPTTPRGCRSRMLGGRTGCGRPSSSTWPGGASSRPRRATARDMAPSGRLRQPDTSPKPRRPRQRDSGDEPPGTIEIHTEDFEMDANPETMSQPMDSTDQRDGDGEWIESPVDDATYDVLMALSSKLEAIDTYRVYAEDGHAELWQELAQDEKRHADRLVGELKNRLATR